MPRREGPYWRTFVTRTLTQLGSPAGPSERNDADDGPQSEVNRLERRLVAVADDRDLGSNPDQERIRATRVRNGRHSRHNPIVDVWQLR